MDMTFPTIIFLLLFAGYLTGSIPTSVWVGKIFHQKDVRDYGSGNAGATNTIRVLGFKAGFPVLLFDMFKGWISVQYINMFNFVNVDNESVISIGILLGIMAVIGHIFPIFAGFRGGKGVATTFGVLLALHPFATLCGAGVFLLILFGFKYVSLSSILAGISFPLWTIFVFHSEHLYLNVFTAIVSLLIILTHLSNIKRLAKGKENKAEFLLKKT